MKHSGPLNRKTPLKRGGPLKRKKPIRKRSMKQNALHKATDALRHSAIEYGVVCEGECCGKRAESCHEITAGPHRTRAMQEPLAQMHLCDGIGGCHEKYQGLPYDEQIAAKVLAIIDAVNRCCGSSAGEVTVVELEDVIQALQLKLIQHMDGQDEPAA